MKQSYNTQYHSLKEMKSEIEWVQKSIEAAKERMQKDFETWLEVMSKQKGHMQEQPAHQQQMNLTQSSTMGNGIKDQKVNENL